MTGHEVDEAVPEGAERPPLLGRLTLALIDHRRLGDYLVLMAIGALPSLVAWQQDLGASVIVDGERWVGFFDKVNHWPQFVLLPAFVYLVRWTFARMADVSSVRPPAQVPPVVSLFPSGPERLAAYEALRRVMSSGRLMQVVLAVVATVMVLDMAELIAVYASDDPARVGERDWSVMYLVGVTDKGGNLLLVACAYFLQLILFVFRFLAIFGVCAHNLFFLRHVWQRRRAAAGDRPLIRMDLDDEERCLGLRGASMAFNTQVVLLVLGGVGILFSRFANVADADGLVWADVLVWPPVAPPGIHFPDTGQWILATAWLLSMVVVALPVLVKLLPLCGPRGPEITTLEFLRECLPDAAAELADKPPAGRIEAIAGRFAAHSFWPAGDNRAAFLFGFSMMVLLAVLYPLRIADPSLLIAVGLLLVAGAWLLQRGLFALLRVPLRFVDVRLVTPLAQAPQSDAALPPIDLGVFVSYRRADSRAYARLLQKGLVEQIAPGRLFMDVTTLRDGQDFVDTIEQAVVESAVLLLLIGPEWLTLVDEDGRRRLDDPDDLVVQEVRLAIENDLHVIPVLVGGAQMPTAEDLPPTLKRLWRRQARVLDDGHWDYDVGKLVEALRAIEKEEKMGRRFRGRVGATGVAEEDATEPGPL
ncbi:MAG TPA: toll/interleukin-1 receptor domain-containing protein [Pseudomonadales bacterium]|nr:toll/interleukin-1 receptor domain-containing protein [Pseudomonadales bacterium]